MAQNLMLDPTKKDYVVVAGSPVPSDRVLEAAYIALTIPKGNWLHGIDGQGSLLYTLQNTKRTASVEQRFFAYAKDAVNAQVVATGQAQGVAVKSLASSREGTSNQIEVIPQQSQLAAQLDFVPV